MATGTRSVSSGKRPQQDRSIHFSNTAFIIPVTPILRAVPVNPDSRRYSQRGIEKEVAELTPARSFDRSAIYTPFTC
jgi:hypothetical protein